MHRAGGAPFHLLWRRPFVFFPRADDCPGNARNLVAHERGRDDDRPRSDLPEGDAIHEHVCGNPTPGADDLLKHQGDGGESSTESKRIDLHHDERESHQLPIEEKQCTEQGGTERDHQRR